ncbi:MAG: relaxase/mobilization nuclease domain-containing protein [Paracoccus sp. (in: a-proteobacteria)]
MRPHITFHSSVSKVLGYLTQSGKPGILRPSEPIGGTIPWLGHGPTLSHAQRMPRPSGHAKNVLHVTLSLPDGMTADRPAWVEMAQMAIGGLGLPPRQIPWLAFRHRDTSCDHLHMMLMAATFAGRPLLLPICSTAASRCMCASAAISS